MKKGFCEFRGVWAREGSRDDRSWDGRSMIENRLSYRFDILAWNRDPFLLFALYILDQ